MCSFRRFVDRRIHRYLPFSIFRLQKITIATALVTSRLDYCNSIFHNIVFKDVTNLERVQNYIEMAMNRSPRIIHSMPHRKWL